MEMEKLHSVEVIKLTTQINEVSDLLQGIDGVLKMKVNEIQIH